MLPPEQRWRPGAGRLFLAMIVAPALPAAMAALVFTWPRLGSLPSGFVTIYLVGGVGPAIVLGPALFLLLQRYLQPGRAAMAAAGAVCASLPWLFWSLFLFAAAAKSGDAVRDGVHLLASNGRLSWWAGWVILRQIAVTSLLGAIGGLCVRAIAGGNATATPAPSSAAR